MTISVQIQTYTGYARFIISQKTLVLSFYMGDVLIGFEVFSLPQPEMLFNGAWNLELLDWLILEYEPKFSPI